MMLSRRDALKVITVALVAGCGGLTPAAPPDLRARIKDWMACLIPADDYGPGADCPEVWALIDVRLEDPATRAWLEEGFADPTRQTPGTIAEEDLDNLLESDGFVGRLHRMFVECYYGSAAGWRDLGLEAPPQPSGFDLPG